MGEIKTYDPVYQAYCIAMDIRDGKLDETYINEIIGYLGEALATDD